MKKKLFSVFLAICMLISLIPVTAFAAEKGELTLTCQGEVGTSGGNVYYKLNGEGEFQPVNITNDSYEPITLTNELGDVSSIAIKFVPNEGYNLDTERGVLLKVNGAEQFNTNSGGNIADFTSESGHTFNLTELAGESTVAESSFELEFGFVSEGQQDPQQPAESEGNFRFTCQGDPNGGSISYKIGASGEFTGLNYSENNTIKLGDTDTSITVKIVPDAENGYLLDTERGVKLSVDGSTVYEKNGNEIPDFTNGYTFNLSSYIGGKISESKFELEFEIKNQNGGGSGYKPYEGKYSGTPVSNVPLKVSGNIDFCINDSELYNISSENEMNLTGDYTYGGSGTVDFYVQWRLDNRYTSIIINGVDYFNQLPTPDTEAGRKALLDACKGQYNEYKLSVPYSESGYTISGAVKTLDETDKDYWQIGNFLWRYDRSDNPDDLIEHGKMELQSIKVNGEDFVGNEYLKWKDGENGGEAVLPAGAEITVKIVPEYGYQLTSFTLNGNKFDTGDDPSVFIFNVAPGNFHLGAKITKVGDEVKSDAGAVKSGEVNLGSNRLESGSAILSVSDSATSTSEFSIDGYEINSVLDINLNQVWYKGTLDDYWSSTMNNLPSDVDITLDLAENFEDVVILHKHGDNVEEIKPTFENGKLSFKTKNFSDFALAVKEIDPDNGGCFQVVYDDRESGKVEAQIGSGDKFTASPNVWDKWYQYSDNSQAINFTVTVPEDRAGQTPIVEVVSQSDENHASKLISVSGSNDTYTFSITPNALFTGEENPSINVFIDWSEFDKLSAGDGEFVVQTVNLIGGSGNINVTGAMNRVDYKSLGDESKYIYKQAAGELHVIFTPAANMELYGFRVNKVGISDTDYGFENGAALPEKQSDGGYDFTLNISGTEKEIIIEALFINPDEKVANPVISPNGGTFSSSQTVEITCATDGADIYYTLDGAAPTTSSTKYTAPFTISEDATVKAIAVKEEMEDSGVVTAVFTKSSSGGTGGSGGSSGGSGSSSAAENPTIDGKEQSWSDVAKDIEKLTGDKTETISLNGNTTIPADVIKTIASTDAKVTLKVNGTFSWTIDGADIDEKSAKSADLSISTTTVTGTSELRGIVGTGFKISGTGLNTTLNIRFKSANSGKFANLFKKVDGKLVFVDNVKVDENGAAIGLEVSEKGEYVVMLGEFSDMPGDMDNDGTMNTKDSLAIIKDILGFEKGKNPLVADINGDGFTNAKDALLILRKFLGLV